MSNLIFKVESMKKTLFFTVLIAGIFFGCASNDRGVVVQKIDKDDIRNIIIKDKMVANYDMAQELVFSVVGEGVAPMDTISPAQARTLAKRAAMADGYRQLASKLYGVRINAKDTIKDAMLKSSVVESRVDGMIKNASISDIGMQDGLYKVEMEIRLDRAKWQELFAY